MWFLTCGRGSYFFYCAEWTKILKKHQHGFEGCYAKAFKALILYLNEKFDESYQFHFVLILFVACPCSFTRSLCPSLSSRVFSIHIRDPLLTSIHNRLVVEVREERPLVVDEHVLEIISVVLKSMSRHLQIVQVYEMAQEKCPENEKFMTRLFGACVESGEIRKQQLWATRLYSKFGREKYFWWAIVSMIQEPPFDGPPKCGMGQEGNPLPSAAGSYSFPFLVSPPSLLSLSPIEIERYLLVVHESFGERQSAAIATAEQMVAKRVLDPQYTALTRQKAMFYLTLLQRQVGCSRPLCRCEEGLECADSFLLSSGEVCRVY